MVDIIAAIPESHKNLLTPFLKVKPVRTASGVAVVVFYVFRNFTCRLLCVNHIVVLMLHIQVVFVYIVLVVPILILSILLNHILVMNQQGKNNNVMFIFIA